jgi:hypothetical protein
MTLTTNSHGNRSALSHGEGERLPSFQNRREIRLDISLFITVVTDSFCYRLTAFMGFRNSGLFLREIYFEFLPIVWSVDVCSPQGIFSGD